MTDVDEVLEQIEHQVRAVKMRSDKLEAAWPDWEREIVLAMIAEDCASALKSARVAALGEMAARIAEWEAAQRAIAAGPLAGVRRDVAERAIDSLYEGREQNDAAIDAGHAPGFRRRR